MASATQIGCRTTELDIQPTGHSCLDLVPWRIHPAGSSKSAVRQAAHGVLQKKLSRSSTEEAGPHARTLLRATAPSQKLEGIESVIEESRQRNHTLPEARPELKAVSHRSMQSPHAQTSSAVMGPPKSLRGEAHDSLNVGSPADLSMYPSSL